MIDDSNRFGPIRVGPIHFGEADLTTCDREPIHIPGAIQPHGVLLALDDAHTVVTVSRNCQELLGPSVEETLGTPLDAVVGEEISTEILASAEHTQGVDMFVTRLPSNHPGL